MSASGFVDSFDYQPTPNNIWADDNSKAGIPRSGNDIGSQITDWLGLTDTKGNYERWLTERDREYERQATNSARAWDEYMDSTKVQRLMKDIEAAGLNPWLALQSGLSAGSTSTTAGAGSSARAVHSAKQKGNVVQSVAMFMIASAKMLSLLAA